MFPFECLTLSRYLRERHGIDWQIGNYAFGATKGHPFLKAVIDKWRQGAKGAWMGAAYDVWDSTPVAPILSRYKHDWPGGFDQDAR